MTALEDPKQVGERRKQDQRAQRYGSEGESQRRGGRRGVRDGQIRRDDVGILPQRPAPQNERDLRGRGDPGEAPAANPQRRERGHGARGREEMQRYCPRGNNQPFTHRRGVVTGEQQREGGGAEQRDARSQRPPAKIVLQLLFPRLEREVDRREKRERDQGEQTHGQRERIQPRPDVGGDEPVPPPPSLTAPAATAPAVVPRSSGVIKLAIAKVTPQWRSSSSSAPP